nr:MAG TPA: tail protein [Bacteriophage sp.]
MEWKLYHKDGTPLRDTNGKEMSIHSLTYHGEWMGECSVSVSIENEAPIDFEIGDYLIYRNERFELNYDPGKAKQGRKNALGNSFKYQDIKFNSLSDELARAEFLDVVLNDNELHYTALPVFQFYVESLDDLLDRLQACMNEQVDGNKWLFYSRNWKRSNTRGCNAARWEEIYGGDTSNPDNTGVSDTEITSTSISIDKQTVWEGLALVNSQFDVNFITRNREVFVGTSGLPTRNVFKYGKGNGLYEVNQDAEADQQIVTRMRAYGSDKNIPDRYYATLNMEVWSKPSRVIQNDVYGEICNIEFYIDDIPAETASVYFTYRIGGGPGYDTYSVNIHDGGMIVEAKVNVGVEPYYHNHISVQILGGKGYDITIEEAKACFAAIQEADRVHFVSGVNKEAFPSNRRDYAAGAHLPNNMACFNLMLPGFPSMSLQDWWNNHPEKHTKLNPTGANLRFSTRADRPWIESSAADDIGVRPGSVFFDTEDVKEKTVEIYPTIKEMEVDGVRIDEIAVGSNIEDNGVFKEGNVPGFKIKLKKEINFDINALRQSDFSVTMVDGMCAGRKFKVSGSTKEEGQWVLTLQRVEDIGLYFPYKDFQINAGDHFVLSGITLPTQYVDAASEKLLRYAIAWLIENDHTKHTYAPKIDEIYMARQHDEAMEDTTGTTKSLHDTIKEGDIFQFSDEDFGISADVIIDSLSITEKEGAIPTYEVSLRDNKEVSTLQKIQDKITAISNSTGDFTPAQVKEYIQSEGLKYFLSKVKTDVAEKLIRFWEGIAFGEQSDNNPLGISSDGIATLKEVVSAAFRSGALGSGFKLGEYNADGDSYLEVDRLLVRKAAEFVKLVIRELQSVGGEIVLSPAAMKISNVVYFEKGTVLPEYGGSPLRYDVYRCYFSQKKGDEEIENQFVMGDLVRCQTFNVKEGVNENVKNRYYWRKVYKVGTDFIDVLADFCDTGSDIPQAGDELVQMGNVSDTARQSVVTLSAYGADAPSLKMYEGVDSYSLENKEVFVLSRQEMFAIADKFRFVTRNANGEIESTQSFAELVMSVDGLRTTVNSNKSEVDGQITTISSQITQTAGKITTLANEQTAMGNKISKIEQTTEKISLQVETTTNLKNCIVGSALRPWDDIVKIAAGLSQVVNIVNGGGVGGSNYAVFNAQGATANTWTGLYFKDVRVTPGKKYTFSIWVKVIRTTDNGAYYTIKRFDNGVEGTVIKSGNYSNTVGDWVLYTYQITVPSGCSRLLIETAIRKNGTINLCRPMLMEGTEYGGWSLSPYDKTEAGKLESNLKSTGIDIENGKITATADKFEIRNNSGETTASVNEKGLLEVGAGLFGGFVKKKKTIITPENIDQYRIPAASLSVVLFDFTNAGSFVEFQGDFYNYFKTVQVDIILPFYNPKDNLYNLHGVPTDEALQYAGQTLIIKNRANITFVVHGGGTINKRGTTTSTGSLKVNEISSNERLIATCEITTTFGNSTSGANPNRLTAVGWNGNIYG